MWNMCRLAERGCTPVLTTWTILAEVLRPCRISQRVLQRAVRICPPRRLCLVPSEQSMQASILEFLFTTAHAFGAVQGALVMPLMSTGFSMGLVKFNLITGVKP